MAVLPVPEGYHTVTPYLVVKDANALLDFMKRAFGAKAFYVMKGPGGEVRHADMPLTPAQVWRAMQGNPFRTDLAIT